MKHQVKHQYQPTITTCGQTAISILLDHHGDEISPLEIEQQVPQVQNEKGEDVGTIAQHMATWCVDRGYAVSITTADCQVIDQSWSKLPVDELVQQLKLRQKGWAVPSLGKEWTLEYAKSYSDFV